MTSFICNNYFTYVLRIIILDVTKSQREKKREEITTAPRMYHQREKKKEKSGTSGCGSFVVAYFQPATSIGRLHTHYLVTWTAIHAVFAGFCIDLHFWRRDAVT